MITHARRWFRHARRALGYALALGLIAMALVAGVTSQLLPLAERHPDRIAAWLSARAGRPVAFDAMETQWTRRGPLLRLDHLRIGSGTQTFVIGDAEILVSQYAGLLPGRSFTELRLRGLDLTLERADDGRWSVRGLPGQQHPGADPLATLERLGELQVIGGKLTVIAPGLGIDATLPKVDLRLQVEGRRVRAGLRAWMREDVSPLDAALDFNRRTGDGRAYAGAKQADLAAWTPLLHLAGVQVEAGQGRAEAWVELQRHRIAVMTVDATLTGVMLRGTESRDANGQVHASRKRFDSVVARARWRATADGWRFDAPTLRIGAGDRMQALDGLLLAGGKHFGLHADRVDAGPLLDVAALSERMAPGLRRWVLAAQPTAILEDVEVTGMRGGAMHAQGRISAIGFASVGSAPGIDGLAGRLQGDAEGFTLDIDPASKMRFDWPRGFGVVHEVRLDGVVSGWREGDGWRVATDALRLRGKEYGVAVRGGLWWQGDGSRPWIDLAAQIDDTQVTVAKHFWVRHLMPKGTIHWLDNALVAGMLRDGRAVVSGDLDDWPFRDRNGLFRADAHIANATLKFQPDWPAAEQVEGDVSFIADGFTVDGKGAIAGVGIRQFHAGIPRFSAAELTVQAQGGADASKLIDLLRQSPVRKEHAETLANVSASGPAAVTFDMLLPMHHKPGASERRFGGTVELTDASLREKRWKLAFDQVKGRAEYGKGGFGTEQLAVRHDGQPGKLSLRAGGYTRDKSQAFEADLEAMIAADDLIARAEDMAWLKPYLEGRSVWTIGVSVPKSANARAAAAPSRLQLRSNLVGTALTLPAPLHKAANVSLPASIRTAMPLGSGEIEVALGNLAAVRAQSRNNQTGVRVAVGSGTVSEPPPASGLIVTGRAATLDAIDWIAFAKGGEGSGKLPLRRIDVAADRLLLLGASFPDARVQVVPASGGTAVTVAGNALAGAIMVPDADGAAIAGRFERVHWRRAATKATLPDDGPDIDPAKIPPLAFDIDDLRFGDGRLGTARVRTRPVAAGFRIEQMQMRAEKQRIDVTGDWLGRGADARTRMQVAIDSDDFGELMTGFGFSGQLAGGDGTAILDAHWAGSPAAFKVPALQGTLALDVKDGRLVEIEPGAGRVLGLLSVAQLPKRLTLDFRDFFSKGFAFNRVDGHVRVAGGSARSDDLRIDGPAAQIRIRGVADLRAQTFDQTIEVLPKAGNLLTVAGAIAGGPVGAAIGAAANAVLDKPLRQLAAKTYRVTGPWKDPKVEVLKREQPRARTAQTEPPSG
jgi:uncharacterized protein (TIGR02099 family)